MITINPVTKNLLKDNSPEHNEEVINNIVKRMQALLKTPGEIVCEQDEDVEHDPSRDAMYFISKGSCKVQVRDKFHDRFENKTVRILEEGSQFGEISMIYNCRRSATVTSIYYLQCAKITRVNYEELLVIYPYFNELHKQVIMSYDDPLKAFLEISLNNIDYFAKLTRQDKNEWIFKMKLIQLEKGKLLCEAEQVSNEMYVIQSGEVQVVNKMLSGREFIVERLYRGSVISHNSFLMKDEIDTDFVCVTPVSAYTISFD